MSKDSANSHRPLHRARKRFGQNFLHDSTIIDNIVAAVHPRPDQHLIEIGPGKGAITAGLVSSGCQLDLIELDRDLLPWLKLQFGLNTQVSIHNQDALQVDFAAMRGDGPALRIVGNLPYNISTPLIFHLLSFQQHVQDMHFMLQKEVVDRMAAGPGSKAYGRLSLMTQYFCQVQPLFDVPPESFNPAPKVQSAVVRLLLRPQPETQAQDIGQLEKVVATAFQQRRKTLRNTLKTIASEEQLQQAGIDSKMRAEELTLADFVRLANHLSSSDLA